MAQASLAAALFYRDPWAALAWLEQAFGFERAMVISDAEGGLAHSQMTFGNGYIMIGREWIDYTVSPAGVGGRNTQILHVHLEEDIDAHCARARAAGAEILQEPADQFYGDRTYRALDLEGHVWNFREKVKDVSQAEQEAATGLKYRVKA